MTVLSDLIAFYRLFLICVCAFTRFDIPVCVRLLGSHFKLQVIGKLPFTMLWP